MAGPDAIAPFGPVYCETGHPWAFVAEPVNTISNLVILIAAAGAYLYLRREAKSHPLDLMVLVGLLFATGLGSFFWHATRTRTGLFLDAAPGVLFLLAFVFLWLRALYGSVAGLLAVMFVMASTTGAMALTRDHGAQQHVPSPVSILPFFTTLLVIGCGFVVLTWRARGAARARTAAAILAAGAAAALFRTIDLAACTIIPVGTHFLWHILLSLAAYLCIVLLAQMRTGRSAP